MFFLGSHPGLTRPAQIYLFKKEYSQRMYSVNGLHVSF